MKKLITASCIDELVAEGKKTVCINKNTIITPAAKDRINEKNLEISTEISKNDNCTAVTQKDSDKISSDLIYGALLKMSENGLLNGIFDGNVSCSSINEPYTAECDPSGFKLVRGNSIKMEVLETGIPTDDGKVQYQELIGSGDKSEINAGFMTVDHCTFDWDVEPQEIYYVVEGVMTITIDGKPFKAYPGDSLFIQKGSKVVFSSGDTYAKVFYSTTQ